MLRVTTTVFQTLKRCGPFSSGFRRRILAFVCVQLFVFYLGGLLTLNRSHCAPDTTTESVNTKSMAQTKCRTKLNELQRQIEQLKEENVVLRNQFTATKKSAPQQNVKAKPASLSRPDRHELANDLTVFGEFVTIVLYQQGANDLSCVETRAHHLRRLFPGISVLQANKNSLSVGSTFNLFIGKVTTKYFLFLDSRHDLPDHTSDHSSGWLLHALENVPELDFVSGSILNYDDDLEIPCYRLHLCNWTLSERYEYERSIDELMICENISPSFMGRVESIGRLFTGQTLAFDEELPLLSTTDFFLRAKKAGAVSGVRPEVMFRVSNDNKCRAPNMQRREYFQALLPFAHKHKIFRFKDADSKSLDLCGSDSPIAGEDICDESTAHKIMLGGSHWAYDGTFAYPYMLRNIQRCLFEVTDFLTSQAVSYSIEGGVTLGAVKMRGVLPWDAGDADIFVFNQTRGNIFQIMSRFTRKHGYTVSDKSLDQIQVYCVPQKLGAKMGGLVSLFASDRVPPKSIQIKTNGKWIPYRMDLFRSFRKYYKLNYFQHIMYETNNVTHCKKKGHNACLPDFRTLGALGGTGGTFREFFCYS